MVVIVNYDVGNLNSIANMLKKAGVNSVISSDPNVIRRADKLILPGVGAFDAGMEKLNERSLVPVLNESVLERKIPVLGLCLGMQLMTSKSAEGELPGLGWIAGETLRFQFEKDQAHLKVPHMGWNVIRPVRSHPLVDQLADDARYYFVHSYHVVCQDPSDIVAYTEYGYSIVSVIAKGNILGAQFHPEKSHKFGLQFLKNFVKQVGDGILE